MGASVSKQNNRPTQIENLPRDVLSNILNRFPAKPLARMRSVSKPWNHFLSQPYFIQSHYNHSLRRDQTFLIFNDRYFSDPELFSITPNGPSRSDSFDLAKFNKPPVIPWFAYTYIDKYTYTNKYMYIYRNVIGSVDGLICISYRSYNHHSVQIWNLSLSAVLTLPPYDMPSCGEDRIDIFLRFGFDPKANDYKVVKVMSRCGLPSSMAQFGDSLDPPFFVVKEWLQVEVFSMRKGRWELIVQRFPSRVISICEQDEVFVDNHDGNLYWLCNCIDEEMKKLQMIVAFDLCSDSFSEICLPDLVRDDGNKCKGLGVLGGRVCVMLCNKEDECEVWVLNESAWVKQYVFGGGGGIDPFGFTMNNEFLFSSCSNLSLYDPIEGRVKSSRNILQLEKIKVVQFVESLVWVSPAESTSSCVVKT